VAEGIPFQQSRLKTDGTILQLIKGVGRISGRDSGDVSFRFFEKHPRRSEQRIRLGALADLARDV
jgi:hypothetical protein